MQQAYTLYENVQTLPAPEDKNITEIFKTICRQGMKKRGLTGKPEYEARIEEEMDLIIRKDFGVYFIVLWDAFNFCKREGIAVGFGRGSSCGSLVNYVLEITEIDPIEHGLLFWRFLSEWRNGLPDVDSDISPKDRPKLKKYLEDKYGKDRVASVATFVYFSAKSAIKSACRVLNVPYAESNNIVKEINVMNDFRHKQYKEFHTKYPDVYKLASALDGRLSTSGYHAAATIISRMPITDLAPTESRKIEGEDFRQLTIALDKDEAEALGFVKYDFLVLKTLDVVSDCVDYIAKTRGRKIDIKQIKLEDPLVFKMISDGHTSGVFQAEASASTKVIKEMGIENFADLVASNALVRPGAWKAFGSEYIARKKGYKKVSYPTVQSEEFLKDTFGFYLFQEQSLLVCTEIAGLSKQKADEIRKITAHKQDKSILEPYKEEFIAGAVKNVSQKVAEKLWADIELTAEYSFNKCLAEDTMIEVRVDNDESDDYEYFNMDVSELFTAIKNYGMSVDFYVKGPEFINGTKVGPDAWHKIKDVHDNGVQDVFRIWTDSETHIDATANHKHRLSKRWKEVYRIHQNDQIWTNEGKVTVAGRKYVGQAQTYDLELESEPHAFYANGFLTHNSHSVAYSKLSFVCAYLKYYFPAEYMTALLNNEKDANSTADYLSECKRLDIDVRTPDVNNSDINYTVKDNVIYMGLSNVKYISDKLAERLINARPFKSYEDMKEKIMAKNSGLNSRVIDSLNKVGATNFPDHKVNIEQCKENFYEYLGITSFDTGQITADMYQRITPLNEYEDKTDAVVIGIVQDIVVKGWIRVDFSDGSGGKGAVFVKPEHGLEKGKRYVFALAKGNLVGHIDLEKFSKINPLVRYLKGEMDQRTHFVAGKTRRTKNEVLMGDILFIHNGQLRSATMFEDQIRSGARPGDEIQIALNTPNKYGTSVKAIRRVLEDE